MHLLHLLQEDSREVTHIWPQQVFMSQRVLTQCEPSGDVCCRLEREVDNARTEAQKVRSVLAAERTACANAMADRSRMEAELAQMRVGAWYSAQREKCHNQCLLARTIVLPAACAAHHTPVLPLVAQAGCSLQQDEVRPGTDWGGSMSDISVTGHRAFLARPCGGSRMEMKLALVDLGICLPYVPQCKTWHQQGAIKWRQGRRKWLLDCVCSC